MPKNKYNAKKTVVDGVTFHSKKEAKMYGELKKLESEGLIERLILQPQFELQPRFVAKMGKTYRPINYIADFSFNDLREEPHRYRVIDCKGYKTKVYMMKKKLFAYKFKEEGLEIEEKI